MKLPSLDVLISQAKETASRFPLAILTSILGALAMIRIIDFAPNEYEGQFWWNIVMTFSLGLPLFIAFSLMAESKGFEKIKKYMLQLIPVVFLLVYFLTLSDQTDFYDIGRYILLLVAFHLLVSFSPFILTKDKSHLDFWNFNQTVFLRFILSGLYTFVLYGGLAIALLSFDKLFEMNIDGKRYGQLLFFIVGIFNTWFFCSGVPKPADMKSEAFPKGLKIFTQYVLLPIIVIYVLILYLYLFKIIFSWNLPVGWVSYLVIGFSTAGIFSLLLIYPLVESKEIKWVKIFSRIFFISLIPQIVLLYLAIAVRTSDYGITERRYYVFVLAFWLTITAIYYIITNFKNIKYIPISLFLIAVLTSAGPWSAFNMSRSSQINRLEDILNKNSILVNGKIIPASKDIQKEEIQDVNSIINFLIDRNKLNTIQPWFNENLDSLEKYKKVSEVVYHNKTEQIMQIMGLKADSYNNINKKKFVSARTTGANEINIQGFDKFSLFESQRIDSLSVIKSYYDFNNNDIIVYNNADTIKFPIRYITDSLHSERPPLQSMTLNNYFKDMHVRVIVTGIDFNREENGIKITYLKAYILTKKL
ncbi:MAG: DUF4153 domain-containing protein [Candidatus Kapaibacterium sp.]